MSEMGEQWSPQTAPARQAEMEMTSISCCPANTLQTMGISMVKVPQLVPVEKARNTETTNTMNGRNIARPAAELSMTPCMKSAAPRRPVIPDRFQERMRIIIGAHMDLKPAGRKPMKSSKLITPPAM